MDAEDVCKSMNRRNAIAVIIKSPRLLLRILHLYTGEEVEPTTKEIAYILRGE